jgi:carboxyl-terminal processing protease
VQRITSGVLFLALVACSSTKAPPATGDSPPKTTPEIGAVAPGDPQAPPPPDPREAALAGTVLHLLEKEHLLKKPIDDELSRAAFEHYLERLDGGKMFLLKADRDALAKYVDKLDDQLKSGQLDLAHDGAKIYAQRVATIEKMVEQLLAAPFDHANEEFVELDPKKTEWAKTEKELQERWRQRLELDILERVAAMELRLQPKKDPKPGEKPEPPDPTLSQIPTTPEGRDAKARADLAKSYSGRFARLKTPGVLDAAADFINAVTESVDPHTNYLPPADKANFDIHMSGQLEGIGAQLREKDHYIEVSDVLPGGASWRHGGIATGDLILAVKPATDKDWVDVLDMKIDDVVKMIRGPKGTVVHLRLQKPTGNQETISITRDVVVVEETYARAAVIQRKTGPAFGYIHLPSFYGGRNSPRNAATDMRRLVKELRDKKVAGIVIDIRSNGGGVLPDSIEITGDLIDQGPVVQVQDSRGRREVLDDERKGFEYDGPVILMVDRFSASASEIVAGALQDYKRAVVVGTGATHGKGTVQTIADLDRATGGKIELGVLKITIQQFFRVSGSSTQREGVTPDILLPDPMAHIESGERELEHAIPWSQVSAAKHAVWPGSAKWNIPALSKSSSTRVAKHPVLAKLATTTAILKARRDDTRVPLAKPAWETRRKDLKTALDAASPDLKTLPVTLTVKPIEDAKAVKTEDGANGRKDDRLVRWGEQLSKDPWLDETMNILAEMSK